MHVLIVNQYYWPEDYGAGVEAAELAGKLRSCGHCVTVITGMPNYPQGHIWPAYRRGWFKVEMVDGVRVVRGRFYTCDRSAGALRRGLSAISFGLVSLLLALAVPRPDVLLGATPPVFMGLAAWLMSFLWRVPLVLNVKDLFSRSILAGELVKPGLLTRLISYLENFLYQQAHHIITNTPSFRQYLCKAGAHPAQVSIVPDWANGSLIYPLEKEGEARTAWGLDNCFCVLYSGNMGFVSALETVIEAAAHLQDLTDLKFVLVGEGVKLESLKRMAADKRLTNLSFYPLQPRLHYPQILAAADVGMVTLSAAGGQGSTQGKLYSILAAGRPVVAVVPQDNDIAALLKEGQCGWQTPPDDPLALAHLLRRLYAERQLVVEYGKNGRRLFEEKYSLDICARQFEARLIEIVNEYGK